MTPDRFPAVGGCLVPMTTTLAKKGSNTLASKAASAWRDNAPHAGRRRGRRKGEKIGGKIGGKIGKKKNWSLDDNDVLFCWEKGNFCKSMFFLVSVNLGIMSEI